MLLNRILSDFQQYRTLLAKVIHYFVSPEKCKNQRYKFLTPDRQFAQSSLNMFAQLSIVARCLNFGLCLHLPLYLVYVFMEGLFESSLVTYVTSTKSPCNSGQFITFKLLVCKTTLISFYNSVIVIRPNKKYACFG